MNRVFGAIDLGASGGRIAAGVVTEDDCSLDVLHRFSNGPVLRSGRLRWDMSRIFSQILVGLRMLAQQYPNVESIGIDGWGVDVALLDERGELISDPLSYRDGTSAGYVEEVHASISRSQLFALNGLQFLPFTTIYQLAALRHEADWARVEHVVMLPDLIAYWLTGRLGTEITNASTTGLLHADSATWCPPVFASIDLSSSLFPALRNPGDVLGPITTAIAAETRLHQTVEVTTVASHDTASAVVAVPTPTREFVYVSSGTWSLVGTEVANPVLTPDVQSRNFTNERGVDGRIRLLRNVGGLWLLQECLRTWQSDGLDVDLSELLMAAAELAPGPVFDVDDPVFISPGEMPSRIRAAVKASDQVAPESEVALIRCILDSLAAAYASSIETTLALSDQAVDVVHLVGGGSSNELLCRLTADAADRTLLAGPAEATALGNVLIQARARDAAPEDLDQLRRRIAEHQTLVRYVPQSSQARSIST